MSLARRGEPGHRVDEVREVRGAPAPPCAPQSQGPSERENRTAFERRLAETLHRDKIKLRMVARQVGWE